MLGDMDLIELLFSPIGVILLIVIWWLVLRGN
jgi:hypothetical protein